MSANLESQVTLGFRDKLIRASNDLNGRQSTDARIYVYGEDPSQTGAVRGSISGEV